MQPVLTLAVIAIFSLSIGLVPLIPEGKDWVDVISSFSTPSIALLIGFLQWQSNEKVRKQSFHKHYLENYQKVSEALGIVLREGAASRQSFYLLNQANSDARLYLADEVVRYTANLRDLALDSYRISRQLDRSPHMDQRKRERLVDEEAELLRILTKEEPHILYRKYLQNQ